MPPLSVMDFGVITSFLGLSEEKPPTPAAAGETPPSEDKPATEDKSSAAENEAGNDTPTPEETPAAIQRTATEDKSVKSARSTKSVKSEKSVTSAADNKSVKSEKGAEDKSVKSAKNAADEKSAKSEKPDTEEKSVKSEKPATEDKIVVSEESNSVEVKAEKSIPATIVTEILQLPRSRRSRRSKSPVKRIKERSKSRSKSPRKRSLSPSKRTKKVEPEPEKQTEELETIEIPPGLAKALQIFSGDEETQELLKSLCSKSLGQSHLFDKWEESDKVSPPVLRQMVNQLRALNKAYPGGLKEYILKAKKLLKDSKEGINPLDGYTPSIPEGEAFELGTKKYKEIEKKGIQLLGRVGFVLVAGGLGERLGYSGAKVGLPTETTTGTCYLQYYCEYIKAVQNKCGGKRRLPLCIMVSNDTKNLTIKLLKDNKCFGLRRRQIFIVQQGEGVPALCDNNAKIALDPNDPYKIVTKPHGHGDIHALLYKEGITKNWEQNFGIEYFVIFQDTNALAFHTLPLMLGVSQKHDFIMNSLAIPRKAKQAIGGIAKLRNKDGNERTINVEYNQLDPLLRSSEDFKDGDVNDSTGYSPFPGNINQLLFKLDDYNKILERTKGVMPDFVNPKYADESKTVFKKPTRLECMMQDFPTVLESEECKKVGFTQVDASLCFSPVKNSVADGVALQEKGIAAGTGATGEADQYAAARIMLRARGCKVEDAQEVNYGGIKVVPGPAIVLKPDFACCPGEYNIKFPYPEKVKISARSTLVVRGPGVTIESLDLDGALVIDVDRSEKAIVRDLVVKNAGWVQIPEPGSNDEKIAMRGFKIVRRDTRYIEVKAKDPNAALVDADDNSDDGTEYHVEDRIACGGLELGPSVDEDDFVAARTPENSGCSIM